MGTTKTIDGGNVLGTFEPELTLTVLPRCPGCGSPHPRAQKLDTDTCPSCGTTCPTGATKSVRASLTGWAPWAIAARVLLAVGRFFASLARSI